MAKCRGCGAEIPDGAEYCEECLSKLNTAKDSESYLDSLLSAVMAEQPERREIVYPKKEASSLVSMPESESSEPEEAAEDDWMQEFLSMQVEDALADEEEPEEETMLFEEEPEEAPMEDVFGSFFDGETELPDLSHYSIFGDMDENTVDRMLAEDLDSDRLWEKDTEEEEFSALDEMFREEPDDFLEDEPEEVSAVEVGDIEDLFGLLEDERGADAPEQLEVNENPEVISAEDLDSASDLFSGIVEAAEEEPGVTEQPVTEFGDFADLFGGEDALFAAGEVQEEPVTEFGDFADLFSGAGGDSDPADPAEPEEQPVDDFFDLFGSDDSGMFSFGAEPVELDEEETASAEDTVPVPNTATMKNEAEISPKKKEKKQSGISQLYHKLFDNVKVDPSKIKKPPTKEELEAQKQAKLEAKERAKEEKDALLAEKKEQERQVRLEKQRVKKEAKAEKKARKLEEAKLLLEEMESTRINRAGASIVFIFFAMIAVVIIVGTSIFSYSLSIRNAEYEFDRDEYTLAYNEIYGLDIKDEDIVLYDRIMTVMYVQKQLNSYYNYYGLDDKPKALDSLLKGLQRYEKYIELAVELEIDSDLDSVRKKILKEISTTFTLTEQEAMEIIQSDSQAEYSKKVYDAVDGMK